MSYTIGYFVYGYNFKAQETVFPNDAVSGDDFEYFSETYCEEFYSGSGDMPCILGEEIHHFDECSDMTFEQIDAIKQKIKTRLESGDNRSFDMKLSTILNDEEVVEPIKQYLLNNKPTVFLTWGTS